jgi:two-component system chemotaxis response regulator CheY
MAKRVLMVDDAKISRDMVRFVLRRAGYQVLEAEDGQKALGVLGNDPLDCIITDLRMPVMDGLDLIRAVRASPLHRATPILLLTAADDAERVNAGQATGANSSIGKPFHPDTLVAAVAQLLA